MLRTPSPVVTGSPSTASGPGGVQRDIGGGQSNRLGACIGDFKSHWTLPRGGGGGLAKGYGGRKILGYGDGCGVRQARYADW